MVGIMKRDNTMLQGWVLYFKNLFQKVDFSLFCDPLICPFIQKAFTEEQVGENQHYLRRK